MNKFKKVMLIYGGISSEREISIISSEGINDSIFLLSSVPEHEKIRKRQNTKNIFLYMINNLSKNYFKINAN